MKNCDPLPVAVSTTTTYIRTHPLTDSVKEKQIEKHLLGIGSSISHAEVHGTFVLEVEAEFWMVTQIRCKALVENK